LIVVKLRRPVRRDYHVIKPPERRPSGVGGRRALEVDGTSSRRDADDVGEQATSATTRMFATAIPGISPIARRVLTDLPNTKVNDTGFDGRSDLIIFETDRKNVSAVLDLGITEDVFVEIGRTLRSEGDKPGWIAGRIWRPARVKRALSVWAQEVRPLKATMTFRVIARVLQERSFKRADLRRQLSETIQRDRPKWGVADPPEIEIWISEHGHGRGA